MTRGRKLCWESGGYFWTLKGVIAFRRFKKKDEIELSVTCRAMLYTPGFYGRRRTSPTLSLQPNRATSTGAFFLHSSHLVLQRNFTGVWIKPQLVSCAHGVSKSLWRSCRRYVQQ